MFAIELAPLLSSKVSVLGLIVGWLLQWQKKTVELPLYHHLCIGVVLQRMQQDLELPLDMMLLALMPCLYFLKQCKFTLIILSIMAILWQPIVHEIAFLGDWPTLVFTILFIQAPLSGIPYSGSRLFTLVFHNTHVLTYTALYAAFDKEIMHILGAFILILWTDERLLLVVGILEYIYKMTISQK